MQRSSLAARDDLLSGTVKGTLCPATAMRAFWSSVYGAKAHLIRATRIREEGRLGGLP